MKKHLLIALGVICITTLNAQENRTSADPEDGQSLNDKVQNPIANIMTIPFSYNLAINDDYTNILDVKPIIPLVLTKKWLLVTETNIPFMNVPDRSGYKNGVGNMKFLATFTSVKQSDFTWGMGPAVKIGRAHV